MAKESMQIASFVLTRDLKHLLEQWSVQEDRSLSATLRQILAREAERRQQQLGQQKPTNPI
ncbi:MAG: hypothetical protein FOGNACKC_01972 [Anaerolineae bacterium]|nr:hypothetical protein [Anaerolineae bacterium]